MTSDITAADQPGASRRRHWINQLRRHVEMMPDAPAIRFRGETLTFARLAERVDALAGSLASRGVGMGDRVALVMGNRPEFIETVLAATSLGAMAVPLNFRLTPPEVIYILQDSGSRVVVVDEIGAPIVTRASTSGTDALPDVICVGSDCGTTGFEDYEALMASGDGVPEALDIAEDVPALIMYTSGTTGRPKGAVLTHGNLQSQGATILRAFGYHDEDERTLIASPLFHIGGIGSVAPALAAGATLVVQPSTAFDPGELLDLMESERVTNAFLVPAQWQAVCAHPSLASRSFPDLRYLGWGAAPASDTLLRRMAEAFPDADNVALFGQTEMSPVTCVLYGRDALRKLGSVGRPIAAVTARVVDAMGEDVAPGEIGEIVYRGPGLMLGYWNKPAETAEAFADGWFHSGDLVRVDEEGYVYVVDRVKDMIISGGENIYCAEVENVLAAHPDILEVSVVGTSHPQWGETPVAFVVTRDDVELDIESLREWASQTMARYKLPTELRLVQALPRNAANKVTKGVLRRMLTPPAGTPSPD